jgi:hypothetical protein
VIGFLRLFFWLRWSLLKGGFRAAMSKGGFSAFGAVLSVVAPVLMGLFLALGAIGFVFAGLAGGQALIGEDETRRGLALAILRVTTAISTVFLFIAPAMRASRSSSSSSESEGLTRLLLLPLSRRHLHACEVGANAADPWLLTLMPGLFVLAGIVAGAASLLGALVATLATVLLVLAFLTLAALLGICLQLLLRNRRRAETVMLVGMMLWIGALMFPAFLESREVAREAEGHAAREERAPLATEAEARQAESAAEESVVRKSPALRGLEFSPWLQVLPSEAHARALALSSRGEAVAALPSLASLAAFAGLSWWLSLVAWRRLIFSPAGGAAGGRVDPLRLKLRALPGMAPATSCVAIATARGFFRTVRGKLALGLTPVVVVFLGIVLDQGQKAVPEAIFLRGVGSSLGLIAIAMSLLSLLPVIANAFASDRAGFTMQALTPISERRLVWGKTIGSLLIYVPCLVLSLTAAGLAGGMKDPVLVLGAIVGGLGSFAFAAPAGAWVSVLLPRHADLGSIGQAGNPHQGAQLIVMLVMGFTMGLGALASWLGVAVIGSAWGGLAGSTLHAGLAWLVAWPLLDGAAGGLQERWEAVLLEAQGR